MPADKNDVNVRRHVAGLLRHEESIDDFIDWFQSAYWQIDLLATGDDYDLAMSIDLLLWEFSGGHIDDEGLLTGLGEDAKEFGVEWRAVAEMPGAPRLAS